MEIEDKTGKLKFVLTSEATISIPDFGNIKSTQIPSGIIVILVGKFRKHSNKFRV
jgi:hypothetical protein